MFRKSIANAKKKCLEVDSFFESGELAVEPVKWTDFHSFTRDIINYYDFHENSNDGPFCLGATFCSR